MSGYYDFNSAEDQTEFNIIPKGTIAKVRMTIQPGGYNDHALGLTGGLATQSKNTGSVYLFCEYVILDTKHAKRRVFSNIGIKSNKGPIWGEMGRSFIKAILNSAHDLKSSDNSEEAQKARTLTDFSALNGITFLAKIDVEKDQNSADKNVIKIAITPDSKDYYNDGDSVPINDDGTPIANSAPSNNNSAPFDDDIPF